MLKVSQVAENSVKSVFSMTMTKAEALAVQAKQVAHYAQSYPPIVGLVAEATHADGLQDGVQYDIATINRHIPRGGAIEAILRKVQL